MTYLGHVKNGQILLDEAARLPEGATVHVHVVNSKGGQLVCQRRTRRIRLDPELARHIATSPEFHPDET